MPRSMSVMAGLRNGTAATTRAILSPPLRIRRDCFAARDGTLIVIAHRVSSALRARRILVLDGTRAQTGDHATLLATSPLYRDLVGYWQGGPTRAVSRKLSSR
jgi:ABC-type transport system involved in Fe-S cluster assembly fused permease/ATPase subunit